MKQIMRSSAAYLIAAATAFPIAFPATSSGAEPDKPAAAALSTRAHAQHLLRRFAFSASPETIDQIAATPNGAASWLAQQLTPAKVADPKPAIETIPTRLNKYGGYVDWDQYERVLVQRWIMSQRQLQAKMQLHWIDHFSVSNEKVGDPGLMWHYVETLRNGGLGNFGALATAVSQESAMLIWLDNNQNTGPVANENFARELMQLYMMGPYVLNQDGSYKLNGAGLPIANYNEADVQALALAMTGYAVVVDWANLNPNTRFASVFEPPFHDTRPFKFRGKTYSVPNSAQAIPFCINLLAHDPSTAPFQAKELLQRFVTETPSPTYISDIAAVWTATVDAPDQLAQVMKAIASHPEFDQAYHGMLKQPVEIMIDMMRTLPGAMQSSGGNAPASSLLWTLDDATQEPFGPPSVFSFYRPGQLGTMVNTSTRLNRAGDMAWLMSAPPTDSGVATYLDLPTLRQRVGSTDADKIARYLLDALLDGGTPAQHTQLLDYLQASNGSTPGDNQVRGAVWLLLDTPDYGVN